MLYSQGKEETSFVIEIFMKYQSNSLTTYLCVDKICQKLIDGLSLYKLSVKSFPLIIQQTCTFKEDGTYKMSLPIFNLNFGF